MRMRTDHRIHAVIDQPPRQLALALVHPVRVLVAPVDEDQNK
jgi:hypothetical protein